MEQIDIKIETEMQDITKKILINILNIANENDIEKDQRLLIARKWLDDAGFWTYKGGNHVAAHFKNASGEPMPKRAAFFA